MRQILTEREDEISQLKEELSDVKASFHVKLGIAEKEIQLLKDNLQAVKRVHESEAIAAKTKARAQEEAGAQLAAIRKEVVKLRKENADLRAHNKEQQPPTSQLPPRIPLAAKYN